MYIQLKGTYRLNYDHPDKLSSAQTKNMNVSSYIFMETNT